MVGMIVNPIWFAQSSNTWVNKKFGNGPAVQVVETTNFLTCPAALERDKLAHTLSRIQVNRKSWVCTQLEKRVTRVLGSVLCNNEKIIGICDDWKSFTWTV